jgi:hypothetical protein
VSKLGGIRRALGNKEPPTARDITERSGTFTATQVLALAEANVQHLATRLGGFPRDLLARLDDVFVDLFWHDASRMPITEISPDYLRERLRRLALRQDIPLDNAMVCAVAVWRAKGWVDNRSLLNRIRTLPSY